MMKSSCSDAVCKLGSLGFVTILDTNRIVCKNDKNPRNKSATIICYAVKRIASHPNPFVLLSFEYAGKLQRKS